VSFQIDDDGTVRNADAADPVQRLKDANRILVRQLAREQKRRKQLEAAESIYRGCDGTEYSC